MANPRGSGVFRSKGLPRCCAASLLTATRDLQAAKRFFRKMLKEHPLLAPDRIGTDGAGPYPPATTAAKKEGLLPRDPLHYISKHLQQGIERRR